MTPAEADRLAIATAERDRARAIAVALEAQLARAEQRLARVEVLWRQWDNEADERGPLDQLYTMGVAERLSLALEADA